MRWFIHGLLLTIVVIHCNPSFARQEAAAVPLCLALMNLETGSRIPVTVEGIYTMSFLYDPEDPDCDLTSRASTCVEFSPDLARPPEFDALRHEDLRVYATFHGTLYGPERSSAVQDTSLPLGARIAASNSALYCPNNSHRTKLVVDSILAFTKVPEKVPWHPRAYRKDFPPSPPVPVHLAPPQFPQPARALEIEGVVLVRVEVLAGKVVRTDVLFGDPVLVDEAVANLLTWSFSEDVNTSFTSRFEYRLERRALNEDENPKIELHLPENIRVIGVLQHL